ncbi:MAG TPA: type VI secretion system contractile sheath large subunit [Candidatus Sulfotelmatobacter sp.]|nr:type VI secretion system contractile sheath large subunit [Candidatus Sulfotelmatobacter sp.]
MSNRFDFGGVNLRAEETGADSRPSSDAPFCIAILGDFSGRSNRRISDPKTVGERRPYLIDRDNFDEVLSRLRPELHLPAEIGCPLVFRFSELDDFHPDRLFHNEAFQKLKGLRERLQDPSTFKDAAEQLGIQPSAPSAPDIESSRSTTPNPVRLASGSLLDEMIEQTESRIALEPMRRTDEVHEFARQLAAKYAVNAPDARQAEVIASVDRAISDTMRAVLHHPDFQALEAIWRATFLLVRQLETGPRLKLYLLDISRQELAVDLMASDDLRNSGVFRLLVEKTVETPGADPFTILIGAFRFGSESEDIGLVDKLAAIARSAGAVLLAEADPMLLGCSSLEESPNPRDWKRSDLQSSWSRVRSQPQSTSVGLALPRFLVRLPYGKETSPLDSFDFEEFYGPPIHSEYLWGNPAFFVALMVGRTFEETGWQMQNSSQSQIENLPLHTFRVDGELQAKPCAEVLLTEEAVERILDHGLMPLVSYKGRGEVRIGRVQSIAEPHSPLEGRWEG